MNPQSQSWPCLVHVRVQRATSALRAATLLLCLLVVGACSQTHGDTVSKVDINAVDIGNDIKLRRLLVRNSNAKGIVLFLEGHRVDAWR